MLTNLATVCRQAVEVNQNCSSGRPRDLAETGKDETRLY